MEYSLRRGPVGSRAHAGRILDPVGGTVKPHLVGTLLVLSLATPLWPSNAAASSPPAALEYVSPIPGSRYHPPETNIILRPGGRVDPASLLDDRLFAVTGDRTGRHPGRVALSDDGETITFTPLDPFEPGEVARCRVRGGIRTDTRGTLHPFAFAFTIAGPERAALRVPTLAEELAPGAPSGGTWMEPRPSPAGPAVRSAATDSLPADFPRITRLVRGPASPGRLFLSDIVFGNQSWSTYLMIVDDEGVPVFQRRLQGDAYDFKLQPDGRATYFDAAARKFYALDASYAVVDSFRCGNGYGTDVHDLQLLPNGHALLLSYDPRPVNMSGIVPGGNPAATVIGLVVQELDRERNVVFQWRSWDHFQITDAAPDIDLTRGLIDYVHGNAIELDSDGNLLLSSRHLDEITKINRRTGDIVWRWGGRRNQFTFVNDAVGFSHQHDIRRLPDGNVTLFDNGNLHVPAFSRAVEYRLDERRRTATRVWEHRSDPGRVSFAMGSVQRLPSGNTLIGWGASYPAATEVTPEGIKVSEIAFDPGVISYRAFRYEWPPVLPVRADIVPKVLNVRHPGSDVTVTIQPGDFDPGLIDVGSVRLAGTVAAEGAPEDRQADREGSIRALRLRFPAAGLAPLLTLGENRLPVEGSLTTGAAFRGDVVIRAVAGGERGFGRPDPRVVSSPGTLPVRLRIDAGASREPMVGVYDVRGRLVAKWRALADAAGTITWDGRSRDGARVRSGLYFLRLEGAQAAPGIKILVVR